MLFMQFVDGLQLRLLVAMPSDPCSGNAGQKGPRKFPKWMEKTVIDQLGDDLVYKECCSNQKPISGCQIDYCYLCEPHSWIIEARPKTARTTFCVCSTVALTTKGYLTPAKLGARWESENRCVVLQGTMGRWKKISLKEDVSLAYTLP